ncbi:coproporphyrinogen-III oxidase family protein [Gemmata sp.]|uniref:coproporphyrinogen-III oxidase family protein n=1 Tax=Gemmata sp. TaxID=1914242 RepID=UPI003F6E46FF
MKLEPRNPAWLVPRTAYAHVPFCGHHCGYCDFAVISGHDHLIDHYLDALDIEMSALGAPRPVETLFIGGGTPTYPNPAQFERLLATVNRWLPLQSEASGGRKPSECVEYPTPRGAYAPRSPGPEFSIESTPDSLTAEKAAIFAARGGTRVSIGVQSFRPESLAALDRRHTAEQIPAAVQAVRANGLHLSLDLIFAAPGSTLDAWAADLDAALALGPDHVSTYGLTYEKGTPLWKQRRSGRVAVVPEEDELAMYELAIDRLTAAGFEHYEVSNFARPGHRTRHNERYWANEAYFGFGAGAARYAGGVRELNTRDTKAYVRKVLSGESPTFQSEQLDPRERAFETVGTQLRRMSGIARGRFAGQTGFGLDDLLGDRLKRLVDGGLLADDGDSVRLTRRGLFVADAVIEELMKALEA